jgi:uncharacterized protein
VFSFAGVLGGALLAFGVVPVLLAVIDSAIFRATGWSALDLEALKNRDPISPAGLGFLNLTLAGWIVVAILCTLVVHQVRPGFLISVAGRIRWRWTLISVGCAAVAMLATWAVDAVVPATTSAPSHGAQHWTGQMTAFALVVLLTTPLQAIGEEFLFRGYLTQAVGSLVPAGQVLLSRIVPVVVPALLFAAAHGSQGLPVFLDRLLFGLLAGVLVIVTGGLEAGIVMHVINNLVAFGIAIVMGDVSGTLAADHGTWWLLPVTLTQTGVFLVLVVLARRKRGADFASAASDSNARR